MPPHLCQSCKQNAATIHLTEIHNDEKRELHVCEACAQSQGIAPGPLLPSLPNMLASLIKSPKPAAPAVSAPAPRCPTCGISFAEFREKGRLGCPNDYEFFAEHLQPLLEKIHGATEHTGRVPKGSGPATGGHGEQLLKLRRDLQQAVKAEQYETAARLRDEIRTLEQALAAAASGAAGDAPAPPPPPPPPAPPQNVAPQAFEAQRISGEKQILPDDVTKTEIQRAGKTQFMVPVKVCVATNGAVSDVRVLKSSGFPAYDQKLNREIRKWRYTPFTVNGMPAPACGMVNFAYRQK